LHACADANLESNSPANHGTNSTETVITNSSFLGGERAARYARGKDIDALSPRDRSDSASDVQGESSLQGEGDHADELGSQVVNTANDSDSFDTGERASATGRDLPDGADIMPDHLIGPAAELDDGTEGTQVKANLGELTTEPDEPVDVPSKNS